LRLIPTTILPSPASSLLLPPKSIPPLPLLLFFHSISPHPFSYLTSLGPFPPKSLQNPSSSTKSLQICQNSQPTSKSITQTPNPKPQTPNPKSPKLSVSHRVPYHWTTRRRGWRARGRRAGAETKRFLKMLGTTATNSVTCSASTPSAAGGLQRQQMALGERRAQRFAGSPAWALGWVLAPGRALALALGSGLRRGRRRPGRS